MAPATGPSACLSQLTARRAALAEARTLLTSSQASPEAGLPTGHFTPQRISRSFDLYRTTRGVAGPKTVTCGCTDVRSRNLATMQPLLVA